MLALREYRQKADRLADHLPWAALVAPGVVLNKDGSFSRVLGFRGPDLESATEAELIAACARANNVLKRFGSGWALHIEAERREALGYPDSSFPDVASWLVDEERRAAFESAGAHFESRYYATLTFLPPPDQADTAGRALVERSDDTKGRDWRQALASFIAETDRALDLFGGFMPEVRALDDSETLTFLHGAISTRRHVVAVPETPMYLDGLLADTPLTGGLEPMLGDEHLRTLTILGFPNTSRPGILDALNHEDFGYRWVTRFIALDKTDATKALTRLRRQWFNKRKSITALLREVIYNQPVQLLDSDADNKVADADLALQALGGDHVSFGYLTTTITVADEDRARVEEKVRAVERIVNGLGFTCIREGMNAVEAWLSSLPGHVYANVRQPIVHTLNLAHLMPLSSVWAGPARNAHLDGPPLLYAETSGSTPFRLSTHVGDVGHMMIVGPTGAGKSVLLALLALQFRRYPRAQVYTFDKGFSARAAVLAMGGAHHALGLGGEDEGGKAIAFQPLRRIDRADERAWASTWIGALLAHEKVSVDPQVKEAVWSALTNLATAPAEERTLTGLSLLLQSTPLRSALAPYTLEGPFGRLLDAAEDDLAIADVQCFETEALMGQAGVVAPVLTYLFHRLEERFTGRPTLLILDEAWVFLDHPLFAARIREWLKVLRKKNVSVVFATQSLADIADSSIAPAIIESCPQRILLPNDRAIEPQSRAAYARFGLNERQIELISRASPKRHYYLQSARGNRLFELGLGPVALWNRTSFLAERVLGNVVSSGIKVMVLAVIVGIGSNYFADFTSAITGDEVSIEQAVSLMLASLALFGLAIFGPGIASGLVAGAPQLGAGSAIATTALAAGGIAMGGAGAIAAARGIAGAGLGAIRAGTSMGSAASTAYKLGQETSGSGTVRAGLGGMATAARGAAAQRMGGTFGLGEAAERGRQSAWQAGNTTSSTGAVRTSEAASSESMPGWAGQLQATQNARHLRGQAVHVLQSGDRGGAGANPDIKERD